MFGKAQQNSECGASPFHREAGGGDSSARISRHSVQGDRSLLSLLKQSETGVKEGGKTFRSSAPVHEDDLCAFPKGGNESSRRLRMLADRFACQATAGASPDHNSESKLVSNVEVHPETSPEEEDEDALRRQPRCLLTRPHCDNL